jgi:Tol biopolymer transport system component
MTRQLSVNAKKFVEHEVNKMLKKHLLKVGSLAGFLLLFSLFILQSKTVRADLLNIKLSDPLQPNSLLLNIKISPDGQYALFTADILTENALELYSVPIDGSEAPTLLSGGLLPAGAKVETYEISPDSNRVVYKADQDTAGLMELYSVSITGGPITKLNPPIGGNGSGVWDATFTQDRSRVVFKISWQNGGIYELYSIPAAGGTPVRLNGDLPASGTLSEFKITPDDSQVVYVASQDTASMFEVYMVPIDGGTSEKLSDTMVAGGGVWPMKMSPDGSRVVYTAARDVVSKCEIFSVSLTDPAASPIKLNPPMGANSDVFYDNFRVSPDGNHVVYLADPLLNDIYFFYSVPVGGGTAVQLTNLGNGVPLLGGDYTFEISSDSSYLVFRSTLTGKRQVFSVPLTGGTVTKLNDPIIPATGNVDEFQISPDSSRWSTGQTSNRLAHRNYTAYQSPAARWQS